MSDENDAARLIGQAVWRIELVNANPEITPEEIKSHRIGITREAQKEYNRMGLQIVRALARQGYSISKQEGSSATLPSDAPEQAAATDEQAS